MYRVTLNLLIYFSKYSSTILWELFLAISSPIVELIREESYKRYDGVTYHSIM